MVLTQRQRACHSVHVHVCMCICVRMYVSELVYASVYVRTCVSCAAANGLVPSHPPESLQRPQCTPSHPYAILTQYPPDCRTPDAVGSRHWTGGGVFGGRGY